MTLSSVITCLPELRKLSKSKTAQQRKKLLACAKNSLFYSICEICKNVLDKNIPISAHRKKCLVKYKKYLRLLARKSGVPLKTKKKIIFQKGGFLPSLLLPATAILAQILADLKKK